MDRGRGVQPGLTRLFGEFRLNGGLPKELKDKLTPEDASVLDYYFRRKWLKKDWNVDPEKILEVNRAYGELDWLLPESYAIYWAHVGLEHTPEREDLQLTRMILQSLVATFNYGRMLLPKENEVSDFFLLVPNTGVIDAARRLYKDILKSDEYSHSPFEALYENFLIDSIVTLYTYSQKEAAAKLYQELRTETRNGNSRTMTLDQFVLNEWETSSRSGTRSKDCFSPPACSSATATATPPRTISRSPAAFTTATRASMKTSTAWHSRPSPK